METQDRTDKQAVPPTPKRRVSWLQSIGAILVVALLIGGSATAFAFWRSRHAATSAQPSQSSGQWVKVLDGYTVASLMAAPSNSSVLYACAIHSQTMPTAISNSGRLDYTLLRSTDAGLHWQEVKGYLSGTCQLAINPTNSNDLYVVSQADHIASNGQVPDILRHSTDGGQTWTEIEPTLELPSTQPYSVWHVEQVSMVGNSLFGIQWMPSMIPPPEKAGGPAVASNQGISSAPAVAVSLMMTRLVESVDGGHTWTVVDNFFNATTQSVRDYVVLPSDSHTLYELVGTPWGPIRPVQPVPSYYTGILTLYKTTDGGKTWTKLLDGLRYGSKIQLSKQGSIYVGGPMRVMPFEGTTPQQEEPQPPYAYMNFLLHMSTDGGATWRVVPGPSQAPFIQNWFVSADGQVYIASSSPASRPTAQPTVTKGTVAPSGTSSIPSGQGRSVPASGITVATPPIMYPGSVTDIQRYDPATNRWNDVTKTPTSGTLLAVTPSPQQNGALLWLLASTNNKQTLYRYEL